jgi:phosphoenolpyruvate synthase/pyruvate phosphate dikinase
MTDEAGSVDNDGQPVNTADKVIVVGKNKHYLEWYRGNTWMNNCKAIALLAENNLPNQPMTINAGFKNQWFAADLENAMRYTFHKFSYASYLMCVNVTPDSLISCRMGISPQVVENGKTGVRFEPFFYYPLGIPKQSNSAVNFAQYRVGSENLYSRKFTNGLVLINPFISDMDIEIPISQLGEAGKTYIDPENKNSEVQSVKLKAGESKILLIKPLNTSLCQTNTEKGFSLKVYPVPASNEVTIEFGSDWIVGSEKADLIIYDSVGNKVNETPVNRNMGTVTVSVSDLKPGIYYVTLPEWNASTRMVVGR